MMGNWGGRRKYSIGSSTLLFFIGATVLSLAINLIFLEEIKNIESGDQTDYIIDGYFYMYLGQQAALKSQVEGLSLFEASEAIRPNVSSAGVVFLSALANKVCPLPWALPILFVVLYSTLIVWLSKIYTIQTNHFLLYFAGLLPYLYIPTKETFFLIGLLLFLISISKRSLIVMMPISASVMYLARPEALYIFFVALVAHLCLNKLRAKSISLLCITAFSLYWVFLRETVTQTSYLFQTAADLFDTGFCKVGMLSVCISENNFVELVYIQRLISLFALPLKWIFDVSQLAVDPTLTATAWILRLSLGMELIAIASITYGWKHRQQRLDNMQKLLLTFALLYLAVYAAVLYFQVTRQALLSLHIALMALTLSGPRSRSKIDNPPLEQGSSHQSMS